MLDFEAIASGATYPFKLFTNRNARLGLLTDLYHGNLAQFVPDCGVYVNLFRRLSQAIAELLMLEPPLPQGFAASDELFLDRFQGSDLRRDHQRDGLRQGACYSPQPTTTGCPI